MKNNFTPPLNNFRALAVTMAVVILLLVNSCKKDNLPTNGEAFINAKDYRVAQQWFT